MYKKKKMKTLQFCIGCIKEFLKEFFKKFEEYFLKQSLKTIPAIFLNKFLKEFLEDFQKKTSTGENSKGTLGDFFKSVYVLN